jgi:hypothetical protein
MKVLFALAAMKRNILITRIVWSQNENLSNVENPLAC